MIYPDSIVDTYKALDAVNLDLEQARNRNFYDKETVIRNLTNEQEEFIDKIQEEASVYAAETGADRDGGYDPDRLFDELEEQLSNGT